MLLLARSEALATTVFSCPGLRYRGLVLTLSVWRWRTTLMFPLVLFAGKQWGSNLPTRVLHIGRRLAHLRFEVSRELTIRENTLPPTSATPINLTHTHLSLRTTVTLPLALIPTQTFSAEYTYCTGSIPKITCHRNSNTLPLCASSSSVPSSHSRNQI